MLKEDVSIFGDAVSFDDFLQFPMLKLEPNSKMEASHVKSLPKFLSLFSSSTYLGCTPQDDSDHQDSMFGV